MPDCGGAKQHEPGRIKKSQAGCAISRVLFRRRRRLVAAGGEDHLSGPSLAGATLPLWESGLPAAVDLNQARRPSCDACLPLLDLAPGGVCHARRLTPSAVRSYRTFSPLPIRIFDGGSCGQAVSFLWHCPYPGHPRLRGGLRPRRPRMSGRWALPTTAVQWCSDFPPLSAPRGGPRGRPVGPERSGLLRIRPDLLYGCGSD